MGRTVIDTTDAGEGILTSGPLISDCRYRDQPSGLVSPRQAQILQAIADGSTTKQVARDLSISIKTVHNHLNAIYRRLDTQSLTIGIGLILVYAAVAFYLLTPRVQWHFR